MSASLVGSEMCIRDRPNSEQREVAGRACKGARTGHLAGPNSEEVALPPSCLLYTSDAADDM
eukprot:1807646-Alexandrium_andersonii.AAC.1